MNEKTQKRFLDIDRAKGLAIMFVVLGHLVSRQPPQGHEWYLIYKAIIYKFHMPFFMYLSGFVFGMTYSVDSTIKGYCNFFLKKFRRLFPGFLIFGLIVLAGKQLASSFFFYVDNIEPDLIQGIIDILLVPSKSVAGFLWYIYVLLALYAVCPLVLVISSNNKKILLSISAVFYFSSCYYYFTDFFMIDKVVYFGFPFSIGFVAFHNYYKYMAFIKKYQVTFYILFASSFSLMFFPSNCFLNTIIWICSLPAIHCFVDLKKIENSRILYLLGEYSFSIYLMNTVSIGIFKGIFFKIMNWTGYGFYIFLPMAFLSGLIIPVLAYKFFFSKIMFFKYITK